MDGFFCSVFSCPWPPYPLPSTLPRFPAGYLSLSRAGVCLGAPQTVNFLQKNYTPYSLTWVMFFSFFPFLAELRVGCGKAPGLKSAVWSTVITNGVLNPSGGGLFYAMGGRESRSETDSKYLSCNGKISSSPVCLCVHCSQHAGSVLCPSGCLENSCWSNLSLEESLISTHCMRSV